MRWLRRWLERRRLIAEAEELERQARVWSDPQASLDSPIGADTLALLNRVDRMSGGRATAAIAARAAEFRKQAKALREEAARC